MKQNKDLGGILGFKIKSRKPRGLRGLSGFYFKCKKSKSKKRLQKQILILTARLVHNFRVFS